MKLLSICRLRRWLLKAFKVVLSRIITGLGCSKLGWDNSAWRLACRAAVFYRKRYPEVHWSRPPSWSWKQLNKLREEGGGQRGGAWRKRLFCPLLPLLYFDPSTSPLESFFDSPQLSVCFNVQIVHTSNTPAGYVGARSIAWLQPQRLRRRLR